MKQQRLQGVKDQISRIITRSLARPDQKTTAGEDEALADLNAKKGVLEEEIEALEEDCEFERNMTGRPLSNTGLTGALAAELDDGPQKRSIGVGQARTYEAMFGRPVA